MFSCNMSGDEKCDSHSCSLYYKGLLLALLFGSAFVGAYVNDRYTAIQLHRDTLQCHQESLAILQGASQEEMFKDGYVVDNVFDLVPKDPLSLEDASLAYSQARTHWHTCVLMYGVDPRSVPTFEDLFGFDPYIVSGHTDEFNENGSDLINSEGESGGEI